MAMKRSIHVLLTAVLLVMTATGCDWFKHDRGPDRYRRVLILYSAGFNNLSPDLIQDIQDLRSGYLPKKDADLALLVVSRRTSDYGGSNYEIETSPYLIRMYKSKKGDKAVMDTLYSMPAGSSLIDADVMRNMLERIVDGFPSDSYGMVVSSHGNGWLPVGAYIDPSSYGKAPMRKSARIAVDNIPLRDTPGVILTKSFGPEYYTVNNRDYSHEIEIEDMAAAIPMHLDYLLFDACLMGGVEVAWAFKDVTDLIGFSQAEILSEGFNYKTLTNNLLLSTPDPQQVCKDFYDFYESKTGVYHSATISLIRTDRLPALASACAPLFEQYRSSIKSLSSSQVQDFGGTKNFYYDLEDILVKAGAQDLTALRSALDGCIVYKASTNQYYSAYGGTFPINAFCGLSMYLPSVGSPALDAFYKQTGWGKASGLVK